MYIYVSDPCQGAWYCVSSDIHVYKMCCRGLPLFILIVEFLHFVFVEHAALAPLASKASSRSHHAFHPKTQ